MFDQAIAERILEQVQDGKSLRTAAAEAGIKHPTFLDWVDASPPLADRYARARIRRAAVHAERIESTAAELLDGTRQDAQAARVAIDALKWTASKLHPQAYGDKLQLDGDLRVQITVNDPFAPLPATAQLLPQPAGAVIAGEIPSLAADGQATPVPPRSAAELCRVPVSENSAQPSEKVSRGTMDAVQNRAGRIQRASQPAGGTRLSPRTGKPVRAYNRRKP